MTFKVDGIEIALHVVNAATDIANTVIEYEKDKLEDDSSSEESEESKESKESKDKDKSKDKKKKPKDTSKKKDKDKDLIYV